LTKYLCGVGFKPCLLKRQTFQPPIQRSEDNVVSPIDNVLLYSVFFLSTHVLGDNCLWAFSRHVTFDLRVIQSTL